MATFTIVSKDSDPLGPNEIRAGDTIDVNSGDVFIVLASVDDDIKFETGTGNPANFDVRFETSNSNDFAVEINDNLDAGIEISNGVDLSGIDIKANDALSVIMTAGDDVSLGKFEGSKDGIDVVTIGDKFTTEEDIKLKGGDNFLTIGDDAKIQKIETKDGDDVITIGDGLVAEKIKTGKGDDAITVGDDAALEKIETKEGDDVVTIGDGLVAEDIKTGKGDDAITVGDDAALEKIETKEGDDSIAIGDRGVVDEVNTDKGDDTVSVGDFFTADKVETKDGDDLIISGSGGSINDLDGGNDNDQLSSETDYPGAKNFESVVCFMRGSHIETEKGKAAIETLRVGDLVQTMDGPAQPIRWIGCREVSPSMRAANPKLHPVRISAGSLGAGLPERDLLVSRQHRMLIRSWIAERMFGVPEVLIPAIKLIDLPGIFVDDSVKDVTYIHLLFDRHEVIFAEGGPAESLFTGSEALKALSPEAREEIRTLFPAVDTLQCISAPARMIPSGHLQKKLISRHLKNGRNMLSFKSSSIVSSSASNTLSVNCH